MGEVLWNCANIGKGKAAVVILWGVCIFLSPGDIQENCTLELGRKYRSPCVHQVPTCLSGGERQVEGEAAIMQ